MGANLNPNNGGNAITRELKEGWKKGYSMKTDPVSHKSLVSGKTFTKKSGGRVHT